MNIFSWLVSYDCIIKIRITRTERSRYVVTERSRYVVTERSRGEVVTERSRSIRVIRVIRGQ